MGYAHRGADIALERARWRPLTHAGVGLGRDKTAINKEVADLSFHKAIGRRAERSLDALIRSRLKWLVRFGFPPLRKVRSLERRAHPIPAKGRRACRESRFGSD